MGRCMARLLKKSTEVTLCGRSFRRAARVAKIVGVRVADIDICMLQSDILIAAVPPTSLPELAGEASQHMRDGALFVDISSVKCGIVEEVTRLLPERLEYVSIHPLFASHRVGIKNVVIVPVRVRCWMDKFRELLLTCGMSVVECSAEEHDRAMATFQVLHHFAYLSLKGALKRLGFEEKESPFTTYSFKRTLAVLRLIEGNIQAIEEIQRRNKFSDDARRIFIEEAKRLDNLFRTPGICEPEGFRKNLGVPSGRNLKNYG
ncbi:MAG: prephenate dehydrogenase/arogenate dehydrogenase family protein [Candidatus Methanomethyliales bacterium]|nr:prephenate dehydrogenase/arogenate dehydrogenase family protein [Candidatus Methanomethylicales archaeon]